MPWMTLGAKIKRLRKSLGLDQTAFAGLVGVTQSAVSRWESDTHEPEYEQLRALAAIAKEPIDNFLVNAAPAPSEGSPRTYAVRVIGSVQAERWVEATDWPSDKQFDIYVPLEANVAQLAPRAFRVQGPSMNLVFAEGSFLICVDATAASLLQDRTRRQADLLLRSGDYVVVQRRHPDGLIEVTVKEFALDDDGQAWLWPRSSHPEFQQPWRLPDGALAGDSGDLRITALVVGVYHTLRRL